mgnify:CR=1 FL=1
MFALRAICGINILSLFLTTHTTAHVKTINRSDNDVDCAEGLVCWYDDGSLKVPGCSGTALKYWEYCIDPSALPDKNVTHSDTLVDFGNNFGAVSYGHCQGDW